MTITANFAELAKSISDQALAGSYLAPDDAAFFASREGRYITDVEIRERVLTERLVVRHAVAAILAAGHQIRVHDGEAFACALTADAATVMAALMSTEEDALIVFDANSAGKPAFIGSVSLIYGNEPWSVIADNSTSVEHLLADATEVAAGLEEQAG